VEVTTKIAYNSAVFVTSVKSLKVQTPGGKKSWWTERRNVRKLLLSKPTTEIQSTNFQTFAAKENSLFSEKRERCGGGREREGERRTDRKRGKTQR